METVVLFFIFSYRGEVEEDSDLEGNNSVHEEPSCRKVGNNVEPKPSIPSRSRTSKRPDKPLYMPRAARERLSLQADKEPPSSACCNSTSTNASSDSRSCSETTEDTCRQKASPSLADGILDPSSDNLMPCPLEEEQKLVLGLQEDEALALEQTQCCFADMTVEEDEKEQEYVADAPHSSQTEDTDTGDVTEEVSHDRTSVTDGAKYVLVQITAKIINQCNNI